ncbi:putative ribosome biogenesis GTPase RsgA [Clostridia bacterium]|nr:putative ribosome biogenesis GTPase RsgA [Clostridia bacterium]
MNGRIVKGIGGLYTVRTLDGYVLAKPKGIFRKRGIKPLIGDFCAVDGETITEIFPRKNEILRPAVANIDVVLLTLFGDNIDLELVDKYIILSEAAGVSLALCLTKTDIMEDYDKIYDIYTKVGYKVLRVSAVSGSGTEELREFIRGKSAVFTGNSGVGKSSIINLLTNSLSMETGELGRTGRGRHTTRHTELLDLGNDTFIFDTPGFSSLEFGAEIRDMDRLFIEFAAFLGDCQFRDCLHINETNCGVKNHVGYEIPQSRYKNYVKFVLKG